MDFQVPSKIKVFLWRLAKHSLPTSDVLKHRNMAVEDKCAVCGEDDSWKHSLSECTMAKCVWALASVEVAEQVSMTQQANVRDWLFELIEKLPSSEMTEAFVSLWAIWHARRKVIHENLFQSPLSTHCFIRSFMEDLDVVQSKMNNKVQARQVETNVQQWIPSPAGWTKVNVDGALGKLDDKAAVAAVARSCEGEFLGAASVVFIGISDAETVEALAIREALSLADDLLTRRVKVASDCLRVINTMNEDSKPVYYHITQEIKARCS